MSWDILLMRSDYPSMAEFPPDYTPPPLGEGAAVGAKVRAAAPAILFDEPSWGRIDGGGWSIDVTVGSEEPVESILLHVHGGAEALGPVRAMAEALGAQALDCSTGYFIDFARPPAGRDGEDHSPDDNSGTAPRADPY